MSGNRVTTDPDQVFAAPVPLPVAPRHLPALSDARRLLADGELAGSAAQRYVAAHVAALRAASAIVQMRGATRARRRPVSVWDLLPQAMPALSEWAAFFAATARKRAAAEAGLVRGITEREADTLLHDAETFVSLAEQVLGVAAQDALPLAI